MYTRPSSARWTQRRSGPAQPVLISSSVAASSGAAPSPTLADRPRAQPCRLLHPCRIKATPIGIPCEHPKWDIRRREISPHQRPCGGVR
jgi:hypothetical protein